MKEYLEKVAEVLETTANYIETLEKEEKVAEEQKVEEEKKASEKEREDLVAPILDKFADEDKEVIKKASPEVLKVINKTLEKKSAVEEDWGNVESTIIKEGGSKEVDPIEAFAMS
ncbi:MAG: hypothetical protein ACTSPI_00145 [Candidatus Heimdallarchaeaceae archaeon]